MRNYVRIMRLDHWHKNLFILPGVFAAWKYFALDLHDIHNWLIVVLALLISSLTSSVNYIINELLDAKYDQYHPTKQNRPAARSKVRLPAALVLISVLLTVVFGLSIIFLPKYFTYLIVLFLISGLVYNVPPLRLKDVAFCDTIVESFNNPIRLLLGWFCYESKVLPPSSALVAYWCLAGFMMTAKRFAEYSVFEHDNARENYRKSFRVYTRSKLMNFICFWISLFSLMFGIFAIRISINVILIFPFIAGFFAWYMKLAFEEDSVVKDPERMFKRPWFFFYSVCIFVALIAILFLGDRITILNWLQQSDSFIKLSQ